MYADSTAGQRAAYELGMTGIPIASVDNNCATGSTALWLSVQAVRFGQYDCAMAIGFEKMQTGRSPRQAVLMMAASRRWAGTSAR